MHKVDFTTGRRLGYLIITVVLAIMSGALGFALFLNYFSTTQFFTDARQGSSREIPVVINAEQPLVSIADRSLQYLASIVRSRSNAGIEKDSVIFAPPDFVGVGVVLTSDGWLITSVQLSQSPYDVLIGETRYTSERVVRDPYTGLSFVKVSVTGLRPVQMSSQRPAAAEVIFSNDLDATGVPIFYQTYITRSSDIASLAADGTRSSEDIDAFVGLADRKGTLFFNGAGDLSLAWSVTHGAVVPARHIGYTLSRILSSQDERSLGITYALDAVNGGALVRRVEPNSMASRIGIQVGDRITGVNADVIDMSQTFSDAWRKYQLNGSIKLTVVRGDRTAVLETQ
mgnify:CR=1 FL=1